MRNETEPGRLDKGLARRTFLARSLAVTAAASAGQLAWGPTAAEAATAVKYRTPKMAPLATFRADAWVAPRPEAQADPTELTIAEAAYQIKNGKLTPVGLVEAYLARINAFESVYKAFNTVRTADVLSEARALTAGASATSPLYGIPLAIKDNYFTKGTLTTVNSYIFADFVPPFDATAVARLKLAGGLVLGKMQMGPLATTRATTPNGTVTTVNAWTPNDPSYDPAGSSTGSATATAGRLATSSIGTQTGGSIIGPAQQQGLTGLKPTMGRISLYGIVPLTYTRDHPGPLARDARDAAIMLTAMAGEDPHDFRSQGLPDPPDYIRAATPVVTGGKPAIRSRTKIGVIPNYVSGADAALRGQFLDTLSSIHKVDLVEVPLPAEWSLLTDTFNAVRLPERSEPFKQFLKQDLKQFGVSLGSWMQGLFLSGDEWITGQRAKYELLERVMDTFFERCDVVLQTSVVPFDILGLPEITFPIGFVNRNGLPTPRGCILGGSPYAEDRLLEVAAAYQQVTDFHLRRPANPVASSAARRAAVATPLRLTPEQATALSE
ncbi:amidase [Motilibacter aurantiacus]|uniref:amidase n=1 Tax=Motilibacter aurantiacus TaxID=2714955 RepID=UPI00140993E1|nr:amidase [Motilibacter aurantiacus]NHC47488.1 amidase [Motilibacter aurantiacus]